MPSFTVRVELHDATFADYQALHAAMDRAGFSRQIRSEAGVAYQLPPAEYDFVSAATVVQVCDYAADVAASTGRGVAVLVSESTSRAWRGLAPV